MRARDLFRWRWLVSSILLVSAIAGIAQTPPAFVYVFPKFSADSSAELILSNLSQRLVTADFGEAFDCRAARGNGHGLIVCGLHCLGRRDHPTSGATSSARSLAACCPSSARSSATADVASVPGDPTQRGAVVLSAQRNRSRKCPTGRRAGSGLRQRLSPGLSGGSRKVFSSSLIS